MPITLSKPRLEILTPMGDSSLELFEGGPVSAGFPSPAQDYQEGTIDLNRELVQHPRSTFCVRVRGTSMVDAGLADGDILVVDRSVVATEGCVAVCVLDGEFTVKHFHREGDAVVLRPSNPAFKPIRVTSEIEFEVWGVVTWVLHRHRR